MSNTFYHSGETRWFLPEQARWDELLNWFTREGQLKLVTESGNYIPQPKAAPFVKQERKRTDEYLLLPDCDTTGIKQRQGRLEIKPLVAGPRPFVVGDAAGRMDQWVKWSLKPSENIKTSLEADLHMSGPWRNVEKRRFTQKYSFDSGSLIPVSPDAWPNTGCNIELTLLNTKASIENWITFGFEAFGPSGEVIALLNEALPYFFTAHGSAAVLLDGRDSLSYPAWLAMLR